MPATSNIYPHHKLFSLSLGQLHSCGGRRIHHHCPTTLYYYLCGLNDSPRYIQHHCSSSTPTYTYTANVLQIITTMNNNPHLYNPPHTPPSCIQFTTASIRKFMQQHPPTKSNITTAFIKTFLNETSLPALSIPISRTATDTAPTLITALPNIAFPRRFSTQQYHRILAANSLHYSTAHTPDNKKLCYE